MYHFKQITALSKEIQVSHLKSNAFCYSYTMFQLLYKCFIVIQLQLVDFIYQSFNVTHTYKTQKSKINN